MKSSHADLHDQGIVSSMYQIGGVAALPFVGPVVDGFGRRIGMFTGSVLIIVGTIIQGLAHGPGQFMGGRFLLGFGVSLVASAGPMYVVEINHPAYRGRVGGAYSLSVQRPQGHCDGQTTTRDPAIDA